MYARNFSLFWLAHLERYKGANIIQKTTKGATIKNIKKTEIINTNSFRLSVFLSIISTFFLSPDHCLRNHADTHKTKETAG
jgi:hypothetical protein